MPAIVQAIGGGWEQGGLFPHYPSGVLVVRFINIFTNVLLIAMILIRFDLEVIMGRKSGRAALVLTDK
ncbi:MAG: hypothetical protein WBJ68_04130, partial [Candidatus Dechloromonas phosphoritropha]